jgi:AraC-like DNA-binding protein
MASHRKKPRNLGTISRLQMGLSAETPILEQENVYRDRDPRRFDMHYGLELGIVLSGSMRRFYRDFRTDLQPGEVWLCGMWEPHGSEILRAPCRVVVLILWPPMLASMRQPETPHFNWLAPFIAPPRQRPKARPSIRRNLIQLGERITQLPLKSKNKALWLRVCLMAILLHLEEDWTPSPVNGIASSDSFTRIDKAIQMVFDSRRRISIREAARVCGMSRNPFAILFKRFMGIDFSDFALRYRLQGAAQDLLQTDAPLKAAARDWGFTDPSHLHRCFRRHYGCSPNQYRKYPSLHGR